MVSFWSKYTGFITLVLHSQTWWYVKMLYERCEVRWDDLIVFVCLSVCSHERSLWVSASAHPQHRSADGRQHAWWEGTVSYRTSLSRMYGRMIVGLLIWSCVCVCVVRSPLMLAVLGGHTDCVYLLLSKGAGVEARDKCSRTALHRGVSHTHRHLPSSAVSLCLFIFF